ncbi:hypothetical protein GSH05_16475, partial [Burkholderia pseudomallei]|uniref:hypothetical protein n=1 Tax=Burkholderia pseudomallei TaxID=28450 RepID=UPI00194033C5
RLGPAPPPPAGAGPHSPPPAGPPPPAPPRAAPPPPPAGGRPGVRTRTATRDAMPLRPREAE